MKDDKMKIDPLGIRPPASPLGYTVEEATRVLNVGRKAVLQFCNEGLLDKRKIAGTHSRITEKSLREFLKKTA